MASEKSLENLSSQAILSDWKDCDDCGKQAKIYLCEDCYDQELITLLRESYNQGRRDALMTEDDDA